MQCKTSVFSTLGYFLVAVALCEAIGVAILVMQYVRLQNEDGWKKVCVNEEDCLIIWSVANSPLGIQFPNMTTCTKLLHVQWCSVRWTYAVPYDDQIRGTHTQSTRLSSSFQFYFMYNLVNSQFVVHCTGTVYGLFISYTVHYTLIYMFIGITETLCISITSRHL